MTQPEKKATAVATVRFMSDGDIIVTLNSCNGVTAKRLEVAMTRLYTKLGELRAVERRKDSAAKTARLETIEDEVKTNG